MMGVVLEDIERIEVLRGSNSAVYGANAFQGVVNIVTRHSQDTQGGMLALTAGQTNLFDGVARAGWTSDQAAWRLTASSRNDDGFANLHDDKRLHQLHLRGNLKTSGNDEFQLLAGYAEMTWGSHLGNQRLDQHWTNSYARAQWTRELADGAQLKLTATADSETYRDFWPRLRADGQARRLILEGQHSSILRDDLRLVWGGEMRHETVDSSDIFASSQNERFAMGRLFANAEWRPHKQWIINAGGLIEKHSQTGSHGAPRLMVGWQALPGHTLRIGSTRAHKQPTLFELRTDWRTENGVRQFLATGQARPESIVAKEIGYLGEWRNWRLTADLRIFEEKVTNLLRYSAPCRGCPNDIINKDPNTQKGWETQLRWQATTDTQLLLNYTHLRLRPEASSTTPQDAHPTRATPPADAGLVPASTQRLELFANPHPAHRILLGASDRHAAGHATDRPAPGPGIPYRQYPSRSGPAGARCLRRTSRLCPARIAAYPPRPGRARHTAAGFLKRRAEQADFQCRPPS